MSAVAVLGTVATSVLGHVAFATLSTRFSVVRRDRRVREDPGYVGHRTVTTQHLVRETLLLGRVVRRVEIDREEIDQNDLIELGCLGASAWRSRFADVIAEQRTHAAGGKERRS